MPTYTSVPKKVNIGSPVDWIGELINLHRLPNESLQTFKLRVLDNYIHPATVNYNGLYNGMARELGQANYTGGIVIDLERVNDVPTLTPDTIIEINARGLWYGTEPLHEENDETGLWDMDTELEFDFHDRTDSYHLIDLLANLNAMPGIEAVKFGTATDWNKSKNLKVSTSYKYFDKRVSQSRLHTFYDEMDSGNFIRNITWSTNTGIYKKVDALQDLADCNEFFLESYERCAHTYAIPPNGFVRVYYSDFPLIIPISTIGIRALRDHHTMDLYTEQNLDEFEDFQDGIPTVQGADFVNELFSVVPQYWGE